MTPQLQFTRVPTLDLELLHARDITHDYPPHLHEHSSITIVLKGMEVTRIGGTEHVAHAGDVLLINPDQVHASRSRRVEYIAMKLRPDWIFPRPILSSRKTFAALLRFTQTLDPGDSPRRWRCFPRRPRAASNGARSRRCAIR